MSPSGRGVHFLSSNHYYIWPNRGPCTKPTCGLYRPSLNIKIYLKSACNIGPSELSNPRWYYVANFRNSHPTHSLLRFLLVSNSLDLILDILLELWSAIVGRLPLPTPIFDIHLHIQASYPLMH
jgi:hypothetical protein